MKVIRKNKRPLILGIMALILALLITAAILLSVFLNKPTEEPPKEPVAILPGEAYIGDSAATYAQIGESKFLLIDIQGKDNAYTLMRPESGIKEVDVLDKDGNPTYRPDGTKITEKVSYDAFNFYYTDDAGELQAYYPSINEADPTFDYTDLYATEKNEFGFTLDKITYLTTALGTVYFDQRIELPTVSDTMTAEERAAAEAELAAQYKRYGFEEGGDAVRVRFKYIDENGSIAYHTVIIGDKLVTGAGYYLMIDGRPYIYTTNVDMLSYAFEKLVSFIKPVLTAAGLEIDGLFEPLLTTDFKQYVNTVHKGDNCKVKGCENGCVATVESTDRVILDASLTTPADSKEKNDKISDGYSHGALKSTAVDLAKITNDPTYKSLVKIITGKGVGDFAEALRVTLVTDSAVTKRIEMTGGTSKPYTYTILAVEAILTDGADSTADGTAVSPTDRIVVKYNLSVDGTPVSIYPMHAVVDMSTSVIPADVKSKLAAVGEVGSGSGVSFTVSYTAANAISKEIKMVLTDIVDIVDAASKSVDKIVDGTQVVYRYNLVLNGKVIAEDLSDAIQIKPDAEMQGEAKNIANLLRGKGREKNLNLEIGSFTGYFEAFCDFITYTVEGIKYFVRPTPIVSFEFEQASERDPFYGDSLYKNTLDNKYHIYALNSTVCGLVAQVLGGSGESTSTTLGLIGLETVDIGITPDKLDKYGLYAYTLYFEIPRGITGMEYDEQEHGSVGNYLDTLDDYDYYSTLGFTLYVSEEQPDGTRYIASELYDIIAKVDGEDFVFLDYDFIEFYARRSVLLTSVTNIKNVTFDFFMEDIYGSYSNELTHKELYAYGGKIYDKAGLEANVPEDRHQYASPYEGIYLYVSPSGECSDSKFIRYYNELKANPSVTHSLTIDGVDYGTSLHGFYDKQYIELDTLATSNFKEVLECIFYTQYVDTLTEQEQAAAYTPDKLLMKMTITLGEQYGEDESEHAEKYKAGIYKTTSSYDYAYEFYRASDRRIMVRIFREDRSTGNVLQAVSDFYISTYAFKKIVNCYTDMLAGENVNNEMSYPENAK